MAFSLQPHSHLHIKILTPLSLPFSYSAVSLVGLGRPGQPEMEPGETEYCLYSETKT